MKRSIPFLVFIALLSIVQARDATSNLRGGDDEIVARHLVQVHGFLAQASNGKPKFIQGNLGKLNKANEHEIAKSAKQALKNALSAHYQAKGSEKLNLVRINTNKNKNNIHVRFQQEVYGMPVQGTSLTVNSDPEGNILVINGEFVDEDAVASEPKMDAITALAMALEEYGIKGGYWIGTYELTVVLDSGGNGVLAWKNLLEYFIEDGPGAGLHRDIVFANAVTGALVTFHPQIHGVASLQTYRCVGTSCNTLVSSSNNSINTGDLAIDAAHNFALATYNYYFDKFGRNSLDDNGMTLKSRVHYGNSYNNAFWDGSQMTYGDGDGSTFIPLSRDADVVAHELTHGVTEFTSGLIYSYESGALNEAFSDIVGACVDNTTGATGEDIWKIGEDIYTPGTSGDALRYMNNPTRAGDYDYYPERYRGSQDNGGVHSNSGIANLAFYLLSQGGQHPRSKTTTTVQGIGMDTAIQIFYDAFTGCLTPSSGFAQAAVCTISSAGMMYGNATADTVGSAWQAVGVILAKKDLLSGVSVTESVATGFVQIYAMTVTGGNTVTCTTSGQNGDADLYLRYGQIPNPSSGGGNACESTGIDSNEACNNVPVPNDASILYISLDAWTTFSGLQLVCTKTTTVTTTPPPIMPTPVPTPVPTRAPTPQPTPAPTKTCLKKGTVCSSLLCCAGLSCKRGTCR